MPGSDNNTTSIRYGWFGICLLIAGIICLCLFLIGAIWIGTNPSKIAPSIGIAAACALWVAMIIIVAVLAIFERSGKSESGKVSGSRSGNTSRSVEVPGSGSGRAPGSGGTSGSGSGGASGSGGTYGSGPSEASLPTGTNQQEEQVVEDVGS